MTAWARPGVKCVCVDDDWDAVVLGKQTPSRVPMLNEILTIKGIITPADYLPRLVTIAGGIGLGFEELSDNWYWCVLSFRPLVANAQHQEQDVALFTHHFDREGAEA